MSEIDNRLRIEIIRTTNDTKKFPQTPVSLVRVFKGDNYVGDLPVFAVGSKATFGEETFTLEINEAFVSMKVVDTPYSS